MSKDYLGQIIDLTGDSYLNPVPAVYDNGEHLRNINKITSISVHHDASDRPHDYDSVARYHQEAAEHYARLGPGLQYHYKIDNVGQIFATRPLTTWLYCVGSAENVTTLAICLDGNFETQQPTREQFEALYQLLENLCEQHPEFSATWPNVRPHADFSSTACCGANLRNHIYPIQDKPSAQAQLLNQGVYDWPSEQPDFTPPTAPTNPPPPPIPAPPAQVPVEQQSHAAPPAATVDTITPNPSTWTKGPTPPDPKPSLLSKLRLPDLNSATVRGLITGAQTYVAWLLAGITNPELVTGITNYFPKLVPALVAITTGLSWLINFIRRDVKNY